MSSQSYRSSNYSKRSSQQSSVSWGAQITKTSTETFKTDGHLAVKSFSQKTSSSSSSSSLVSTVMCSGGGQMSACELDSVVNDTLPPAIPQKTRRKQERQPSPYDNVPDSNLGKLVFRNLGSFPSRGSTLFVLSSCFSS